MAEFRDAGIGILIGRPSMIGEAALPAAESNPFRLKIIFISVARLSTFPGLIENFGLSFFHDLLNDDRIGNQLLRLKWGVFDTSLAGDTLLLGDRPVVFFGGIADPNFTVALPIAPTALFVATQDATLAKRLPNVAPKALVARMNDVVVRQAAKYIYGRDGSSQRFIENRR